MQKGAWTRLLSAPGAWLKEHGLLEVESELPGGDVFSALPLYVGLATCPRYTELWRKSYKSKVHINVAELQAFLREEARAGHRKPNSRMIFALDSQVCKGAVAKGRSASFKLNDLLCRSIPAVVGSQIQSVPIFFPSAYNPADNPTRDREVRPPIPSMIPRLGGASCVRATRAPSRRLLRRPALGGMAIRLTNASCSLCACKAPRC